MGAVIVDMDTVHLMLCVVIVSSLYCQQSAVNIPSFDHLFVCHVLSRVLKKVGVSNDDHQQQPHIVHIPPHTRV